MFIKIDDDTRHTIEEISALSGIQRDVVREVWEFTLINWLEKLTRSPEKLNNLTIPFMGQVGVKYVDDVLNATGGIDTNVNAFISLSPFFTSLIGDVIDERQNVIIDVLQKKIDNALANVLEEE